MWSRLERHFKDMRLYKLKISKCTEFMEYLRKLFSVICQKKNKKNVRTFYICNFVSTLII